MNVRLYYAMTHGYPAPPHPMHWVYRDKSGGRHEEISTGWSSKIPTLDEGEVLWFTDGVRNRRTKKISGFTEPKIYNEAFPWIKK